MTVIAALALSACGSSGNSKAGEPSSNVTNAAGDTKQGGSVTMLLTGMGASFDPVAATAFGFTSGGPMNAIFGNLTYNDSATNTIKMGLLKSLTPNADFSVWTGVLTPGLKFSDGTPFDAESVVFNLKRAADPTTGSLFVKNASSITSVAPDATTFVMTLKSPNVHFDAVFTEDFSYIGSPTAIKASGSNFKAEPVGGGPFKLKSRDGTNTLVLERNDNYALFKAGEPRLDQVTFQAVPEFSKQSQALASNQAQIAGPYGGDATQLFKRQSNLNTTINQTGAGSNLQMSVTRPPFNDPRAREAISLALDRAAVSNAFQPGTPAQVSLFPEDSPFYSPEFTYAKQDKARAQQLFDELAAEGKPVNFDYTAADQPQLLICAQLIQSQLLAFKNVKMTIKSMTTAQYISDQRAGNYQMAPVGLYLINPIPELEDEFVTGGFLNTMGYSNATVDAAFDSLHTTSDPAKEKEAYAVIQKQLLIDNPVYWVGQGLIGFAVNKDLLNVTPVNYGNAPLWGPMGYKS